MSSDTYYALFKILPIAMTLAPNMSNAAWTATAVPVSVIYKTGWTAGTGAQIVYAHTNGGEYLSQDLPGGLKCNVYYTSQNYVFYEAGLIANYNWRLGEYDASINTQYTRSTGVPSVTEPTRYNKYVVTLGSNLMAGAYPYMPMRLTFTNVIYKHDDEEKMISQARASTANTNEYALEARYDISYLCDGKTRVRNQSHRPASIIITFVPTIDITVPRTVKYDLTVGKDHTQYLDVEWAANNDHTGYSVTATAIGYSGSPADVWIKERGRTTDTWSIPQGQSQGTTRVPLIVSSDKTYSGMIGSVRITLESK